MSRIGRKIYKFTLLFIFNLKIYNQGSFSSSYLIYHGFHTSIDRFSMNEVSPYFSLLHDRGYWFPNVREIPPNYSRVFYHKPPRSGVVACPNDRVEELLSVWVAHMKMSLPFYAVEVVPDETVSRFYVDLDYKTAVNASELLMHCSLVISTLLSQCTFENWVAGETVPDIRLYTTSNPSEAVHSGGHLLFPNVLMQKGDMMRIVSEARDHLGELDANYLGDNSPIDVAVYARNGSLRPPYATKDNRSWLLPGSVYRPTYKYDLRFSTWFNISRNLGLGVEENEFRKGLIRPNAQESCVTAKYCASTIEFSVRNDQKQSGANFTPSVLPGSVMGDLLKEIRKYNCFYAGASANDFSVSFGVSESGQVAQVKVDIRDPLLRKHCEVQSGNRHQSNGGYFSISKRSRCTLKRVCYDSRCRSSQAPRAVEFPLILFDSICGYCVRSVTL